jgi:hypothetical protein
MVFLITNHHCIVMNRLLLIYTSSSHSPFLMRNWQICVFPHYGKAISYLRDMKISETSGVTNRILWGTVTELFNVHKTGTVPGKLGRMESLHWIVFWRSATFICHATLIEDSFEYYCIIRVRSCLVTAPTSQFSLSKLVTYPAHLNNFNYPSNMANTNCASSSSYNSLNCSFSSHLLFKNTFLTNILSSILILSSFFRAMDQTK